MGLSLQSHDGRVELPAGWVQPDMLVVSCGEAGGGMSYESWRREVEMGRMADG